MKEKFNPNRHHKVMGDFGSKQGMGFDWGSLLSDPSGVISQQLTSVAPTIIEEYVPESLQSVATKYTSADRIENLVSSAGDKLVDLAKNTSVYQDATAKIDDAKSALLAQAEQKGIQATAQALANQMTASYYDVKKNISEKGLISGWLATKETSPKLFWTINGLIGGSILFTGYLGYRVLRRVPKTNVEAK